MTGCAQDDPVRSPTALRRPAPTATRPKPLVQLPRGGRTIFPTYRVVAFYGAPGVPNMGILGQDSPVHEARSLAKRAALYQQVKRPVLPAFEVIATMAQRWPGFGDRYCGHQDDATLHDYLKVIRRIHGLLIIDIQPGRSLFLPEAKRYEKFLEQPDVELAMDSEWRMGSNEIPGQTIGHVSAAEINAVSAYLVEIVKRKQLPQKILIVHQFAGYMVGDKKQVLQRPGLAITFHIDGFGSRAVKLKTYHDLSSSNGRYFNGIKLFFDQDVNMFSTREILAFRPVPDLITYQ